MSNITFDQVEVLRAKLDAETKTPASEGGRSRLWHDDPPFERLNPPPVENESKPCEVFYRRAGSPAWASAGIFATIDRASDMLRFFTGDNETLVLSSEDGNKKPVVEVKVVVEVMRWERSY